MSQSDDIPALQETNALLLYFNSAYAKAEESSISAKGAISLESPELLTCGPYRPITFTTYSTRLMDIRTPAHVALTDPRSGEFPTPVFNASFKLYFTLAGLSEHARSGKVTLRSLDRREVRSELIALSGNAIQAEEEEGPGKGSRLSQVLYEAEVALLDQNSQILSALSKRISFRTIELVQALLAEADQHGKGTTFMFVVNGVRMFTGGSNWIPES
ncbi:hypothetical protein BDQ12DRAFT_722767 [Crucibulum laeve]|uniref:Uncharacterized protein n=1 Tax=Crucibulum laeve TaxID=68775 RepID=A0A5C3MCN8_9AGAR|nr:hypothetical protein BDQ12DRAFT_722767 [Crucibulum laeve]